ncbi:ABC transporter permease [Aestuariimicrobium sp. T2.26MG-19.2B]|uniref:ABC transporter permease n=1 Tax=Aestuariimicrobium sp. T2.26MG-19.2B TaxID=3040679 RepID=UPI00247759DA|nr:ABC transporter permease [Aestuariimicrobium sp. T2.26MG-19.2B]CAI9411154.1 putative iron export permease protein FetB [Aestuariimicrobium sp. T2.26MG-19.2B]
MTVEPSWQLAVALVVLVVIGTVAATWGRLPLRRSLLVASVRAALQLAAVSAIIVGAIQNTLAAVGFVLLMFAIGVHTTATRTGTRRRWPWVALAMASGALPVLLVIFGLQVAPFTGISIIPIAGIMVGNMMSVHTLNGRRLFAALRDAHTEYEAGLSVGLTRSEAIDEVTHRHATESLVPSLDSTRTTGLVTLPGAFIGVMLGGGSPVQAGAAQVLVLVGILAGQFVTVTVSHRLIRAAKLLPVDLVASLRP